MRILPLSFALMLALLLCVSLILAAFFGAEERSEENTKLRIAVSGDTENEMMQLGIAALSAFDDTRFAMELVELPENEAIESLSRGEISAVVVFPEDFIERALRGEVGVIRFITSSGAQNVVTLLKNEITKVITDMALACEKGTYSIAEAIEANSLPVSAGKYMNELSIEFAMLVFSRSEIYSLKELGISEGIDGGQYYVCAMCVFLFMLFGVCFSVVCVKRDNSLDALLASKGFGSTKQILCEYAAHFVSLCLLIAAVAAAAGAFALLVGSRGEIILSAVPPTSFFGRLIPVVLMLAAFNMMIFELTSDLISASLLHFLSSLGLCYASGCFYPVYALPLPMQKIAGILPSGVAREFLEGAYTGEATGIKLVCLVLLGAAFLAVSVVARRARTLGVRGVRR